MKRERATIMATASVILVLLWLTIVGTMAYVIYHFIAKYW